MTLNGVMAVILRYFIEFGYLPVVLRKSSRSLSHLLMSSGLELLLRPCKVLWWVCHSMCLSVCLSASWGATCAIFNNFLRTSPISVAQSSCGMLTIGCIAYRRDGGDGSAQRGRNVHHVSKNVPPLACYNFDAHEWILLFFWQKCYR